MEIFKETQTRCLTHIYSTGKYQTLINMSKNKAYTEKEPVKLTNYVQLIFCLFC